MLMSAMVLIAAVTYIKPVIEFMNRLVKIGGIENEVFQILLKSAGIALISQVACTICTDGGNQYRRKFKGYCIKNIQLYTKIQISILRANYILHTILQIFSLQDLFYISLLYISFIRK